MDESANRLTPPPRPRGDNRLGAVLDAAAARFAAQGYAATSIREIAGECGMHPGSLYYHFATKEDLLCEVYRRGVEELRTGVGAAVKRVDEPWARLEAACASHLEIILRRSDYAQVLVRVLPSDVPGASARLKSLRSSYEKVLRELVSDLPLAPETDRQMLRLMLLGALNWSRFWFDPEGSAPPAVLARKFVSLLRQSLITEPRHD